MEYEWDNNKNASNQKKHGIDFYDALKIFEDDYRIETIDDREEYGEKRFRTVGMVEDIILTVVYTTRQFRVRLISARRASKDERETYYHHQY